MENGKSGTALAEPLKVLSRLSSRFVVRLSGNRGHRVSRSVLAALAAAGNDGVHQLGEHHANRADRIVVLPAMGWVMSVGSALVSTMATVGILRRRASATALSLARGVDDDDGVGQLVHGTDAFEVAAESLAPSRPEGGEFLLAHHLVLGSLFDVLDVLEPLDGAADRGEIGQRAAQPALVDVELPAGLRGFLDGFLRLLLAADEENLALDAGPLT